MLIRFVYLFCFVKLIYSQWTEDLCITREQDGHSNEEDSISELHCEYYDRLHHNNESTLQVIDVSGTIAGCWLYETDTTETFYYNKNANPSGMCSSPHQCIQYTTCLTDGETPPDSYEILYVVPTPAPTSQAPTITQQGISLANLIPIDAPTDAPTREPPAFATHNILVIAAVVLTSISTIGGYIAIKTNAKADISYV